MRPLQSVIGDKAIISPVLIDLARWMADYYCCPVETAMRSVLPQVIRDAEVGDKKQLFARLVRPPTPEEVAALQKRAPRQAEVVQALQEAAGTPMQVAALTKACGATHQTIQSLVKAGLVETTATSVARDPYEKETFVANAKQTLTAEQDEALKIVHASMDAPATEKKPVLLFGVTGSGKTEVYLQAIARTLERGQTALVLVPEISLTPQTVERFKSRFASTQEQVAVLHSHLSAGERHDEWHKIHGGKAQIVIGARSAVFAPLSNLGLIVVDEEHENSYKQEEAPRYQARDLAVLRAKLEGCAVVLGSATPSIESYHNAMTGKYDLALLTMRVDDQKMPLIRIVDLRSRVPAPQAGPAARALGKTAHRHWPAARKKGADDPVPQPARVCHVARLPGVRRREPVRELQRGADLPPRWPTGSCAISAVTRGPSRAAARSATTRPSGRRASAPSAWRKSSARSSRRRTSSAWTPTP